MLKIYEEELKKLKERMAKAEIFANKVPVFKELIIKRKYTGEEESANYEHEYKDMKLVQDIYRSRYVSGTKRWITNYTKEHNVILFAIRINICAMFNLKADYDLEKIIDKCNVFFYDRINHEFYIEDEYIGDFLENLYEWYMNVKTNWYKYKKEEEIEDLEKKLNKLKIEEQKQLKTTTKFYADGEKILEIEEVI